MQLLIDFKEYLADRPETAFLALTLVALFYMFRKYDQAQQNHLATLSRIAPLADRLARVIDKVKKKKNGG